MIGFILIHLKVFHRQKFSFCLVQYYEAPWCRHNTLCCFRGHDGIFLVDNDFSSGPSSLKLDEATPH